MYIGAAVATASLLTGFGLAGYWFGTFSHIFNQTTASGLESTPYGVHILQAGAAAASEISYLNFTNWSWVMATGPCENFSNNTNVSSALNLTNANASGGLNNNSANATHGFICLNSVNNAFVNDTWWNGTFTNYTQAGPINASEQNETTFYNQSLGNITGFNASTPGNVSIKGCLPVVFVNATNNGSRELADCAYFASNNNTTFEPHTCYNASALSCYNSTWRPNQTGYYPSDEVFFATVEFNSSIPANTTFEIAVSFDGATPVPQVFYVNTGNGGNNSTVTVVFDMTAAWLSAVPGSCQGNNTTTCVFASINVFSVTVDQCYVDASARTVCPNVLQGTSFP